MLDFRKIEYADNGHGTNQILKSSLDHRSSCRS